MTAVLSVCTEEEQRIVVCLLSVEWSKVVRIYIYLLSVGVICFQYSV
jgi:hypothetical protein